MKEDRRLRTWWAKRRRSADIDAFHSRIMRAVEEDRFEAPVPAAATAFGKWMPRLGYALAGAAALVVVLFVARRLGVEPGRNAQAELLAMAKVAPEDLATGGHVFYETAQLFQHRLRWIAESHGDVAMGIDSCPEGTVGDSPPAFVRVMIVERAPGQSTWENVWKADVIVRGEEVAEIIAGGNGKHKLMLWVYPLEDGNLLVDTDMSLGGARGPALRESSVMVAGEPIVVASGRQGDIEYRVLQTVEKLVLPGGTG